MTDYTIDELIEKTDNKYVLCEIVSQQARRLKEDGELTIGYKAINQAIDDLMNDRFGYVENLKR